MKNKWCYDCYFKKQKPRGIFKKIYYVIWFLINYPFSPSKVFKIYAFSSSEAINEGIKKGFNKE